MKKELIIFDMDGTLINSGNVISNTINFVRRNLGLDEISKTILLENINNPNINSSEYFYGTTKFTDEQTALFSKYYDENCIKDIELYDGIKDLLEVIKNDFILSIATNASVEFANKMIKYLGIDHYFSYVIGSNDVDKPKPAPDMIKETLKHFELLPCYAIVVGDSYKDKISADEANVDTILVNWGFTKHLDGINTSNELLNKLIK